MVPLSHRTCQSVICSKSSERPRCQKPLIVITSATKTAFIDHPGSGHTRRGTKPQKVTRKVFISPRPCSLLFAKPDIPLRRSRTRISRSPKDEKLLLRRPERRYAPVDLSRMGCVGRPPVGLGAIGSPHFEMRPLQSISPEAWRLLVNPT